MTPRIAAATGGLVGGAAAGYFLVRDWHGLTSSLGAAPSLIAALNDPTVRFAWTVSGSIVAFAVVALLIALIGGLVEVRRVKIRTGVLRHEPAYAGRWGAADWREAFARTAIANQAEAVIAAVLPIPSATAGERRIVVDSTILLRLERLWLDRLVLKRAIAPLAALLLGLSGTLALFQYGSDAAGGETALAAGVAGWLAVNTSCYLTRLALGSAVELAVDSATAAIRPLTTVTAFATSQESIPAPPTPGSGLQTLTPVSDLHTIAVAIETAMTEPLARLTDAVERLNSTAPAKPGPAAEEEPAIAVDSALAEVRAGIERLLSGKS